MSGFSRRSVMLGAIGSGLCMGSPALALGPLHIPEVPMRLVRRVERGLGEGARIVVDREWVIEFTRQGSGCAVTGRQVAADVDAPASLASLAKLEAERTTDSMFPILLTDLGLVLGAGTYVEEADLAQALRNATRKIETMPVSPDLRTAQVQGLAMLQKGAGQFLDQIPRDLFYPTTPKSVTVKPVALENGIIGEFELHYEAKCAPDGPWLAKAERRVVTRIGDSERQSTDVWTMTQA